MSDCLTAQVSDPLQNLCRSAQLPEWYIRQHRSQNLCKKFGSAQYRHLSGTHRIVLLSTSTCDVLSQHANVKIPFGISEECTLCHAAGCVLCDGTDACVVRQLSIFGVLTVIIMDIACEYAVVCILEERRHPCLCVAAIWIFGFLWRANILSLGR